MQVNQIRIGAVLSYLSMGLSTVISLVYTPIMVNNLGKGEYGVYSTVIPIVSYLTLLSLGLGSAYVRYYSRAKVEQNRQEMAKLNGMFILTYTVLGLVLLALGFGLSLKGELVFGSKWTAEQLALGGKLLRIMSLSAALSFPFSVFESHVTIYERYLFQKILLMGKQVLNPLLTIPLLLLGFRSEAVAWMSLFFTVASGLLNVYYCFFKLRMPVDFRRYDFGLMREMVGFTVWVFVGIVVDNINWGIGQLMMNWQRGAEAAAVYNLSNQLNTYYLAFATAVANVLTPRVHRMVAQGEKNSELSKLFTKVGRIQFMVMMMVLLGFVAIGQAFMAAWAQSDDTTTDYIVTLLLFASTLIPAIQTVGLEIQRAKNMHKFRSVSYLIIAIVNALLMIPMCRWWGGIGVASCILLTTLVGNVLLMNWYYRRHIHLNIRWFWKKICQLLPSMILPLLAAVAIAIFANVEGYLQMALWGCAFVAVYAGSLWLFGMNRYERDIVSHTMDRIFGKLLRRGR